MEQSQESLLLQEYARNLEGSYPSFVRSVATGPQEDGVDKALWEYVEQNQPDYEEMMAEYVILCGFYDGEITAKELAAEMQEVIASQN